jgi:hypothetical protein
VSDSQIPIPYLAPADWGAAKPLARLTVEGGRFYLRGAAHVIRAGHQVMPGARVNHAKDYWTLSMPANRERILGRIKSLVERLREDSGAEGGAA